MQQNISNRIYTYNDIKKGARIINDKYNVGALFTDNHRKTFLSNPKLNDEEDPLLYLALVDGEVGGILMLFPNVLLIDNKKVDILEGSTLEVADEFRHIALGLDLMLFPLSLPNNIVLYAGISEMALPIYKKIGFTVLEYPRSMQLRKSISLLASKGLKGVLLQVAHGIVDIGLKSIRILSNLFNYRLTKKYSVKEETHVPEWIDEIMYNDTHKYKELHDHEWLEWNLKYNLHGRSRDVQRFYTICKGKEHVGFFMIKERYRGDAGGKLKNVVIGSIVEWGAYDETTLRETDIYKIAMNYFADDVDIVEFATANLETINEMKKFLFIPHGYAHIIFNDLKKQYNDITKIDNWRVRYGYSDVILT